MSKWDFIKDILKQIPEKEKNNLKKAFNDATNNPNTMEVFRANLDPTHSDYKKYSKNKIDDDINFIKFTDESPDFEKYYDNPHIPAVDIANTYQTYKNYAKNKKYLNKNIINSIEDDYKNYLQAILLDRKIGKSSKNAAIDYLYPMIKKKYPEAWEDFGDPTQKEIIDLINGLSDSNSNFLKEIDI